MSDAAPAYRALIVDYGGVLTTSLALSFAAFFVETGVSPDRFRTVLAAAYGGAVEGVDIDEGDPELSDLVAAVETGRISGEAFDRRLAAALSDGLPEPLPPENLTGRLFGGLRPDPAMRAAVAVARGAGLRTGLVSNTWTLEPPEDGLDGLFDAVVLSGRVGMRKPDPEIYLLAATELEVEPEACVFVDDIPVNVDGARAVGMAGVLHRDAAITIPKLGSLLGVDLSRQQNRL